MSFWVVLDRFGSFWVVLGSLWVVVHRFGSFWVILGRFGSFRVLVTRSQVTQTIKQQLACSRLSISGSERKQRRAKNQAIQGERAGARALWEGRRPRSPAARRTDPLTEGLEQAKQQ